MDELDYCCEFTKEEIDKVKKASTIVDVERIISRHDVFDKVMLLKRNKVKYVGQINYMPYKFYKLKVKSYCDGAVCLVINI